MRPISLVALLASSLLLLARPVSAGNMPRIGLLGWAPCDATEIQAGSGEFRSFLRGMMEFGYRLDETFAVECRSADGNYRGLAIAAAELVRLRVDVIVTSSQPAGRAAHDATRTIPIVTVVSGDPVADGLAVSLARPGGNLTGVSYYATELTAKRLELLKATVPTLEVVGVLANPDVAYLPFEADARRAADQLGLKAIVEQAERPAELETAFARLKSQGAQAVLILPDVMFAYAAPRLAELGLAYRLATMAWGVWFSAAGCLMAYSADYDEMNHRLAFYVDRIIKGADPGVLPIEQPTTFRLSVNLKTAAALGIEVPQTELLLADQVIQ